MFVRVYFEKRLDISITAVRRGAGGERKAPCIASLKDNFAVRNFPLRGIDAPTPARGQGLQPYGALTLFFRWRKKSVQKKASGTALREKALYCPFLKEGVRNVARSMVKLTTFTFVRARAHSNPLSKRARLFPSAAYRRSAFPQAAWGRLTPCGVTWFLHLDCFAASTKEGL